MNLLSEFQLDFFRKDNTLAPRPLNPTGIDTETLNYIGEAFSTPPPDLTLHSGMQRLKSISTTTVLEWGSGRGLQWSKRSVSYLRALGKILGGG